jgi:hypothetical protein
VGLQGWRGRAAGWGGVFGKLGALIQLIQQGRSHWLPLGGDPAFLLKGPLVARLLAAWWEGPRVLVVFWQQGVILWLWKHTPTLLGPECWLPRGHLHCCVCRLVWPTIKRCPSSLSGTAALKLPVTVQAVRGRISGRTVTTPFTLRSSARSAHTCTCSLCGPGWRMCDKGSVQALEHPKEG